MKEIHLIDKQVIIKIMDKVEDNYDFTSEDSRLMAFTYLWDELKEAIYAKKDDELVIPTELLEKDPNELAQNESEIQTIISYLQKTRENIRSAEKAGKRITSKTAKVKTPEPVTQGSILDVLIKDV